MQQSVRQALRNLHLIHPQRPNFFESKSSYQKGCQNRNLVARDGAIHHSSGSKQRHLLKESDILYY